MSIELAGYREWGGRRRSPWRACWAIVRTGLWTILRRWVFWGLIGLGLLNFLPVPILDGGLLVFFTLELFKRRPPSPRARQIATKVGLVVVVTLMLFALRNDVMRFFPPITRDR